MTCCCPLSQHAVPVQVFPHHENEIAQSQAAACDHDRQHMTGDGKDFVRYWMHNGFVNGAQDTRYWLTCTLQQGCQWLD